MNEKGTLYQLREFFDRRGVRKDAHNSVHDSREFLRFVTHGYLVLAAMEVMNIANKDEIPSNFTHSEIEQKIKLQNTAEEIFDKFVAFNYKNPESILANRGASQTIGIEDEVEVLQPDMNGQYPCGYIGCNKVFQADSHHRAKHRHKCQCKNNTHETKSLRTRNIVCGYLNCEKVFVSDGIARKLHRNSCTHKDDKKPTKSDMINRTNSQDYKFNYISNLLREGLLDLAHADATREGDGLQLYRLWKYDFLRFKAGGHTNYAILSFQFIAQIEALLSERMAAQLLHNRCVSFYGGQGSNMACDYALELKNGEVKPELKRKPNLTDKAINRTGKSLKKTQDISNEYDKEISFYSSIGRHVQQDYKKDVNEMVTLLRDEQLFKHIPGRKFKTFPKFPENTLNKIDGAKINTWIDQQKQKTSRQQRSMLYGYRI